MASIQPTEFANEVYEALKSVFTELIKKNKNQNFYVFGLFTDDSLQFLHPVANTEEMLTKTVERYKKTVDPKYGTTSTRTGMRWSYGDWVFFPDVGKKQFRKINRALSDNFERLMEDDDDDPDTQEALWNAILSGFLKLEKEHFFGKGAARAKVTLLVVGDLPEDLIDACLAALNPPGVVKQYRNWNTESPDENGD